MWGRVCLGQNPTGLLLSGFGLMSPGLGRSEPNGTETHGAGVEGSVHRGALAATARAPRAHLTGRAGQSSLPSLIFFGCFVFFWGAVL